MNTGISLFKIAMYFSCVNWVVNNGSKKIQWANDITLNKDYMSFCTKIIFSYKCISKQNHLQIVIKKCHECYFVNMWVWTWTSEHEHEKIFHKIFRGIFLTCSPILDWILWHVPKCCHVKGILEYSITNVDILTCLPCHNVHMEFLDYLHNQRKFCFL
jgi:hypothetical protein